MIKNFISSIKIFSKDIPTTGKSLKHKKIMLQLKCEVILHVKPSLHLNANVACENEAINVDVLATKRLM